jgi:hypothetical protein
MRCLLILLLFIKTHFLVLSQVATFERSYIDTSNFNGGILRAVELDSGEFYVASAGGSLFIEQGGYERIFSIDDQGLIKRDNFHYDANRRFNGFCSLIKSADGNLILYDARSRHGVLGGNQIFVLKIKPNLTDTLWIYYHRDSTNFDSPWDIIERPNGDLVLLATRNYFENPDLYDGYFIRLDSLGQLKAESVIDEGIVEQTENILNADDGGFIVAGAAGFNWGSGNFHSFIIKLDSNGVRQSGFSIPQLSTGGMSRFGHNKLLLSGYGWPYTGPKLLMVDSNGSILFNKTYSSINTRVNYIGRKVSDGGIVSVGIANRDGSINIGYIMKTDSLGSLLWSKEYDHNTGADFFLDFIETKDGGLLVTGAADDQDVDLTGQNAWVVKLDANGCLDPQACGVNIHDVPFPDVISIYPNPAKDWLTIELVNSGQNYTAQLLDATGRLVQQEAFSEIGSHTLSLQGLAVGVYYCRILKGTEVFTWEKIVKVE